MHERRGLRERARATAPRTAGRAWRAPRRRRRGPDGGAGTIRACSSISRVSAARSYGGKLRAASLAAGLHAHQRIERIAVETIDVAPREAAPSRYWRVPRSDSSSSPRSHVARQDHGNVQPDAEQRLRDADERRERLLVGRRIHDDVGIRAAHRDENSGESSHRPRPARSGRPRIPDPPSTHRRSSARRESLASVTPMLDHSDTANAAVPSIPTKAIDFAQGISLRAASAAVFCLLAAVAVRAGRHVSRTRPSASARPPPRSFPNDDHRIRIDSDGASLDAERLRRAHRARAAAPGPAHHRGRPGHLRREDRQGHGRRARWTSRIRGSASRATTGAYDALGGAYFDQANFHIFERNGRGFAKEMAVTPGRHGATWRRFATRPVPVGNQDWMMQAY